MDITVPAVIAVVGGICVLAAIFGGMTGTINLPTLTSTGRTAAGVVGAVLLLAGAGMYWYSSERTPDTVANHDSRATPGTLTGSPTPTRTTSAVAPQAPKARIAYPPHDGESGAPLVVSQQKGLVVRGVAQGLTDEYLWLMDYDPEDGRLYEVSESPIRVANGIWSKQDGPIGDEGVVKVQYVVIVRADAECNRMLSDYAASAKKNNTEPFSIDGLPVGCTEDDRAPVNIAKP